MGFTSVARRWVVFNAVGALGVLLQLGLLAILVHIAGVHFVVATVCAVEAALLHNFLWHQRWTWKDRPMVSRSAAVRRFLQFNLLNGGISLAGNVGLMLWLTGGLGLEPVLANAIAIVTCSAFNFIVSETVVFKTAGMTAGIVLAAAVVFAGPGAAAATAWKAHEARIDARFAQSAASGTFFAQDSDGLAPGWRQAVRKGGVKLTEVPAPAVPDGQIHHWVGSIFVPNAQLADVVARLRRNAGNESAFYDDVIASRLLSSTGDRASIFMKLRRESVVTVVYNTEHAVEYRQLGAERAATRSVATRIAEVANAGTPREREKAPGDDHGFLWRLNAYWRYEQAPGGVLIECESVTLSRSIPWVLRPVAAPMVDRIARESLEKTLRAVRAFLTR